MTEHQINETKIKIHNNFHTPIEKVKATFRGLKTLLLGGGLVCWGYFHHVNKDILFLCVFLLASQRRASTLSTPVLRLHKVGRWARALSS